MSFDREHVLLTWGGDLPGGEHWTCSLRTAPVAVLPGAIFMDDDDIEGLSPAYVAAVKAFHTRTETKLSMYAKLTWVKLAVINEEGFYKEGGTSVKETVFAPLSGAESNPPPPNQVALAITLVTAKLRGYARQGRFYLPLPQVQIDPTEGLMAVSNADTIKGSVKTFLEAIADVPGVDTDVSPDPVVMSRHGNGTTNEIIGAKVGRALDTQRRRRRSLPENYRLVDIDTGAF